MKQPGKHKEGQNIEKHLYRQMVKFIGHSSFGKCADIGEANIKMEHLKQMLSIEVDQIVTDDFNFDTLNGNYDTVFCFDIIEHLQNLLFFMLQVKKLINDNGVIYLSCPNKPKIIWHPAHYYEQGPKHLTKWIFEPLGLTVIRKKRLWTTFPWYF